MPKMTTLECPHCLRQFERKASMVAYDMRRGRVDQFCSRECSNNHQRYERLTLSCANCGVDFTRREEKTDKQKTGNHFCSRRCAVSFNNSPAKTGLRPKRNPIGEQTCQICGEKYMKEYRTKTCPGCISTGLHRSLAAMTMRGSGSPSELRPYLERTIRELIGPKGPSQYRLIRDHAQRTVRDRPQVCAVTGYSKHVHTAHIRPIPEFASHTPLRVVNDPRNLALLSPNVHTELDCGELEVDELPDAVAFREFEREAIEAGYLVSA